jgi:hypothetical protein
MHALFSRLDVAWQKFRLLPDLLHAGWEGSMRETVHTDLGFIADVDAAYFRLRNINHDVKLVNAQINYDRTKQLTDAGVYSRQSLDDSAAR